MSNLCHQCGNSYQRIASHWGQSAACEYPSFSDEQLEILTGLLMGDGWIDYSNRRPRIGVKMITPDYLRYLCERFGRFGGDVNLVMSGEENAAEKRRSGFRPNADAKNYSDIYKWTTMSHPELEKFARWYSSGEKVWPENLDLTPTVLTHWYCGDGNWNNKQGHNFIQIGMKNEIQNTNKVSKYFSRRGLPTPTSYDGMPNNCIARFNVDESKQLWKYMRGPPRGFEYKWPEEYR